MHNQPYVGRIALCTRKRLLKSGEIRDFYGIFDKDTFLQSSGILLDALKHTFKMELLRIVGNVNFLYLYIIVIIYFFIVSLENT